MLRSETLPVALHGLLQVFRSCFTAPSFHTFSMLTVGLICRTGPGTVCGMLTAAGLAGTWHHSRAHWFFTHARWQADSLGLALAGMIIDRLLPADAPVEVAVDDTLLRRSGRKIYATAWHHDATSPTGRRNAIAWGNNWIVVGILITLPFTTRPVCLPILARLWRTGDNHKSVTARHLVELLAALRPDRQVHVVADAFYGTKHWRGIGEQGAGEQGQNITLTVRLRANAALTEIHTPTPDQPHTGPPRSGLPGRPKLRGTKIGRPDVLATREPWQPTTITRYGRTDTTHLIDYHCLWTGPLLSRPIRVILLRDDPTQPRYDNRAYDLALLTTDLTSTAAQIIARYATRWAIEVAFHEAKHLTGVGHARNRTQQAVERTVPFGLLTHSLVICWYALTGHQPGDITDRRRAAPWYNLKTEPSYQDMIVKLRRVLIAARFKPAIPRPATTEETLAVHQAWANAAA